MFFRFNLYFENRSITQVNTLTIFVIFIIGLLDFYTGYELSFSIFYVLPISVAAWYSGKKSGLLMSAISAIVWYYVDKFSGHLYSNAAIPFWNGVTRLGFFILISLLLVEIKILLQREITFARLDNLTGLMNARYFKDTVLVQMEIAQRYKHGVVFGYIDLDNFKSVNDNLGHSEGDKVLQSVGSVLKSSLRVSDFASRLGGDEFAVFLPETELAGAKLVFTKIRAKLKDEVSRNKWPVGFSMGVAVFKSLPLNPDHGLKFADNLMYKVKKSGKDKILYEEFMG